MADFQYLGAQLAKGNLQRHVTSEAAPKFLRGTAGIYVVHNFLVRPLLPQETKRIWIPIVQPTLLHGCQTWSA